MFLTKLCKEVNNEMSKDVLTVKSSVKGWFHTAVITVVLAVPGFWLS